MVNVRISQTEANNEDTQTARQKAKANRLRLVAANQTPVTVKVFASSPEVHAVLRHPSGAKFRGDFGTATEWPHDSFTHRRLRDGSVSLKAVEPRKYDPSMSVRDNARAMRPDREEKIGQVMPVSAAEEKKKQEPAPAPARGKREPSTEAAS